MPHISNPFWHEALSFLDDVKAVLREEDCAEFRRVLDRAHQHSQFSGEDLDRVVSALRDHKQLLLRFSNVFLLDGEIAYYRDENGQTQIMGNYSDDSMVYGYQSNDDEPPSPTDKAVAVARLYGEVCHEWDAVDRAFVTAVVGGEKTAIEDLDHAVDIVTKDKNDQETERLAVLLGKILPDGPNKGIIGVWSKMPDLVEKKIALWSPDSRHGWTFYVLENATNSRKRKAWKIAKTVVVVVVSLGTVKEARLCVCLSTPCTTRHNFFSLVNKGEPLHPRAETAWGSIRPSDASAEHSPPT